MMSLSYMPARSEAEFPLEEGDILQSITCVLSLSLYAGCLAFTRHTTNEEDPEKTHKQKQAHRITPLANSSGLRELRYTEAVSGN